ncbi:MAG: HlyD family type I secretion periplasmic adaptor subunit, partial [Inquilinus sp.]|nr:HlyD family type I secretion periplasmic adaptor subunit [Inquilinus sp.]
MAAADTIARDERRALGRSLRRPAIMILLTLAVFFGGFGTWAYLAPLAGASIARATISPAGSRKTIQHLEGGIIESILVEDGDLVELGQPLVVLQDIQALSV